MSAWSAVARPARQTVMELGREAVRDDVLASLRATAAREGEVLGPVTHEWWEDGTLRCWAEGVAATGASR